MGILQAVLLFLRGFFAGRVALAAENLALRHQRTVLQRYVERPKLRKRDRDGIYGQEFRDRMKNMDIEEVIIAPRAPWQNPYAERLIGSIRRECLDHVIVFGQRHLRRVLANYFGYYHEARAHLSLDRNSPNPRRVHPPEQGKVVAKAYLGGLHHRYTRAA